VSTANFEALAAKAANELLCARRDSGYLPTLRVPSLAKGVVALDTVFKICFACLLASTGAAALAATHRLAGKPGAVSRISIPGGRHGLRFDDVSYSVQLRRVIVPAAQTGALVLIRPGSHSIKILAHVARAGTHGNRRTAGATSADYGAGLLFAGDHGNESLVAVSPATGKVVSRVRLLSGSDYVRFVAPVREVWVTEPRAAQIQRFALSKDKPTVLRPVGVVSVPGGPESLVIDPARRVAYTNEWQNHTLELTLDKPHIAARWSNPCEGSRGLALAAQQRLLFVGCKEGTVAALDTTHGGKVVSTASVGAGVDIIAWNARLQHLYAPGGVSETLSVLALTRTRRLRTLATWPAAAHSHCVATDGDHQAYVCDPAAGTLIVYRDRH